MKHLRLMIIAAIAAAFIASCGGAADNKAGNANAANTGAKPAASAPTAESLLELDKKATEAWFKGDARHFEDILAAKFVSFFEGKRGDRNAEIEMIRKNKCEVKSWSLDEPKMSKIDDTTYVVVYKVTFDGECTMDGKSMKIPSPVRAASVWQKVGDLWQGVYHNETLIIDPKAPAPAPEKAADKKEAPKAEPKKEDAKAADAKAGEPKKDDKSATASPATAPAPAKPTPSANTDALVKLHTAGWEAFKAKDAKWFEANMASSFSFVDPIGNYVGSKAEAIKMWTETMKCEGITKVGVSEGFASSVSPTVEILTLKGMADGTCDGQKNGNLWQTAIYAKEGDAWKLAFMFESPAK